MQPSQFYNPTIVNWINEKCVCEADPGFVWLCATVFVKVSQWFYYVVKGNSESVVKLLAGNSSRRRAKSLHCHSSSSCTLKSF